MSVVIVQWSGVEEAILHWSGKFWSLHFEHVEKGPPIDTQSVAIVQSTISMQSMVIIYCRGSVACFPGKFRKTDALRLNYLGAFQGITS